MAIVRQHVQEADADVYQPAQAFLRQLADTQTHLDLAKVTGKLPSNLSAWKLMQDQAAPEYKDLLDVFNDALCYTVERGIPNLPNSVQIEEALKSCVETIWKGIGRVKAQSPRAPEAELEPRCRKIIQTELAKCKTLLDRFISGYTVRYTLDQVDEMAITPPGRFDFWLQVTLNRPLTIEVFINGKAGSIKITKTPFDILLNLAKAPHRKLEQKQLIQAVWGQKLRPVHKKREGLLEIMGETRDLMALFRESIHKESKDVLSKLEKNSQSTTYKELIELLKKEHRWPAISTEQIQKAIENLIKKRCDTLEYDTDQAAIINLDKQFRDLKRVLGEFEGRPIIFQDNEGDNHFYHLDEALSICLVTE
jgi:hypothetical protein